MRLPMLHPFLGRRTHSSRHRQQTSGSDRSKASSRFSNNGRSNPPTQPSHSQVQSHQDRAPRRKRHVPDDDDLISQLPDDILVDIISFLPLKEAARTSVLSSRWVNVWKYTPYLNFDVDSALERMQREDNYEIRYEMFYTEVHKYFKWVNRVVRSNKAPILKEFRICFPLDMTSGDAITQWLEFAFARQVQRLELDLENYRDSSKYYSFPEEFLSPSSPCMPFNFKSLRQLTFKDVNVTDRAIEFFLNNCPLLEKLVVHGSHIMSKLEVGGSSLMLKHLEIVYCMKLESLKVSAPCLTYLRTTTLDGLLLENVPMLVDVFVNCNDDEISMRTLFCTLSCCISQLEILHLIMRRSLGKVKNDPCKYAELPKLKKLVIEYSGVGVESLSRLAALITASHYIEELVLKYEWYPRKLPQEVTEVKNVVKSLHHHLKVAKFIGFYGRANDYEMVSYIFENCVVLEKLIIDPNRLQEPCLSDVEPNARTNADLLQLQVPEHIELVIL